MIPAESTVVLFDWNGTVVLDSERARYCLNTVLHRRSLPVLDTDEFADKFHLPLHAMFLRLGVHDVDAAEIEWNESMTTEVTTAREGAQSLRVLAQQGVRLGLVSAAFADSVHTDINVLGLGGLWASIDAPASDKLAALRARRGTEERAFYVGDTTYDMRCATAAGYTPLAVDRGYTGTDLLTQAGAVTVLTTFDDLLTFLCSGLATQERPRSL